MATRSPTSGETIPKIIPKERAAVPTANRMPNPIRSSGNESVIAMQKIPRMVVINPNVRTNIFDFFRVRNAINGAEKADTNLQTVFAVCSST